MTIITENDTYEELKADPLRLEALHEVREVAEIK